MGRKERCGAAVVLPTAPAYSIGGKHRGDAVNPGPGVGKYAANQEWGAGSMRFGQAPHAVDRPYQTHGESLTGTRYLKPDYLSPEQKAPAWSFGSRYRRDLGNNPGVGAYSPGNTDLFGSFRQASSSWGPPPRSRPPSAPPHVPEPDRDRRRPKPNSMLPGATMKGTWPQNKPIDSPGPAAYNPCGACGVACCEMCDTYKGWSFGHRQPGRHVAHSPSPNEYHVGCSTLGAAVVHCDSATASRSHRH